MRTSDDHRRQLTGNEINLLSAELDSALIRDDVGGNILFTSIPGSRSVLVAGFDKTDSEFSELNF